MNYYVSIDIGASSGRLMLGYLENQKIKLEEIYCFENEIIHQDNQDQWDVDYLINSILEGLEIVKSKGIDYCVIGIDTWAVDYCLIDKNGDLIKNPVSYRDKRTDGVVEEFAKHYNIEKLYKKTGIQIQPFNTIFQLYIEDKDYLNKTDKILLIPDYIAYRLTNTISTESTNASTTQMVNSETKQWDDELLNVIGISKKQLPPIVSSGTIRGHLNKDLCDSFDLPDAIVVNIGSHDTASAVGGIPGVGENWLFLSSGTWSLIGKENNRPIINLESFNRNYSNEGGIYNTTRFLKNIIGMWYIQELSRNFDNEYSFGEIAEKAEGIEKYQVFLDVNNPMFVRPENMFKSIQKYCQDTNQSIPTSIEETARIIFDNLALSYSLEIRSLAQMLDLENSFEYLYIVGGGSKNRHLNQQIADVTQMKVVTGPSETTSIGNILVQMVSQGEIEDIENARELLSESFEYKIYYPKLDIQVIKQQYEKFIKENANE